jgi:hypothetical protein
MTHVNKISELIIDSHGSCRQPDPGVLTPADLLPGTQMLSMMLSIWGYMPKPATVFKVGSGKNCGAVLRGDSPGNHNGGARSLSYLPIV